MAQHRAAPKGEVIGFYGHGSGREYREFSNFYWQRRPYEFRLPNFARKDGFPQTVLCPFSEKAIMLIKAALMNDRATFDSIAAAEDPATAKALGKTVSNFDDGLWLRHLDDTAFEVVCQKFESDPCLAEVLLSTGDAIIAEATRNDVIWGIGLDVGDWRVQEPALWRGRNVLGTALMRTRDHLRSQPRWQATAGKGKSKGKGKGKGQAPTRMRWVKKAAAEAPAKVLGFYSHQPGARFCQFSNFWWQGERCSCTGSSACRCFKPFEYHLPDFARKEGFPAVVSCEFSEKAIMVTKAALMGDRATFEEIVAAWEPQTVKMLGRRVSPFDDGLWRPHLNETAFEVVRQKFESDDALAEVLLFTGDAIIAEATVNDVIWGIGINVGDPRVQDPEQWLGENVLGYALMRTREHLRAARRAGEPAAAGA